MSWSPNPPYCYADLHIHSTSSDGVLSPSELAGKLNRARVKIAALTDHDSLDGIREFREKFTGRTVSGTELSVMAGGEDIHLLGYNFDMENPSLNQAIQTYRDARYQRIFRICEKLGELGVKLDPESLFDQGRDSSYGRPHIARKLLEAGVVRSVQQAFDKYLSQNAPAYVPKHRMSLQEGVALIHQAGGIAVLAHPMLYFKTELMDAAIDSGIDGIELYHPQQNAGQRKALLDFFGSRVRAFSGGSDFHGNWEGRDSLGLFGLDFDEWTKLRKLID